MMTMTKTKTTSNIKQFFFRINAVVGLTLLTATAASPAFARSPSSFQFSCTLAYIQTDSKVANLVAFCGTRNGARIRSVVRLKGIDNQNGILVDNGGNSDSSFQRSCYGLTVVGDELFATCFKANGQRVPSKIKIEGISNQDGFLTY